MKTRYLEFVEGTSSKFYEIVVRGATVNIRFGRIGTTGQSLTKQLPTAAAAEKFAAKQIAAKLAKGYRELTAA
jgi:DNA ligase-1